MLTKVEKGAEFTYGVHSPSLLELVDNNAATIMHPAMAVEKLEKLDKALMGSVRSLNETHGLLRQGIAYTLPWTRTADNKIAFLVYCRTKINNEGQLAMKLSMAPGGHIEKDDLEYHLVKDENSNRLIETPILDHVRMLANNLQRELQEEVYFHIDNRDDGIARLAASHSQPCGFVLDTKDEPGYVGNIHFGALYLTPIPCDTAFSMKEKHNVAMGWYTAEALKTLAVDGMELQQGNAQFEPWSKLVIERIKLVEQVIDDIWPAR